MTFKSAAIKILDYFGLLPTNRTLTGLNIYSTNVGRAVTEESALGIAAVWSSIRLLAEVGGNLPLHFYRRGNDDSTSRIKHKLDYIVSQEPNAWMTSNEYWESMIASLATWGNAYSVIVRSGVEVIGLIPVNPANMTVQCIEQQITYRISTATGIKEYQPKDIFHIKLFSFDGLVGLSPIGTCRQALGMAVAAEEYGARFYSNGATPSGFVSPTEAMTADQITAFKARFNSNNQGLDNAHKIDVLPVGFKWQQITIPPEDSQFIESRKFSIEEIARIFRVPPHLIGDLSHATFSNIESQGMSFVQFTLMPYLSKIEAAIVKALIEQKDKGIIFPEFNVSGLMRGDSAARAEYYSKMTSSGIMTRNEARRLERLSPMQGGDELTIQLNMSAIQDLPSNK
ncbi:phage portal protein [Paludibaculum fermentans]|uniref:phage portal protein n=1 Tax=Paludibaculum fermentans TaxID=1473598 RepID=UPI003EB92BEF